MKAPDISCPLMKALGSPRSENTSPPTPAGPLGTPPKNPAPPHNPPAFENGPSAARRTGACRKIASTATIMAARRGRRRHVDVGMVGLPSADGPRRLAPETAMSASRLPATLLHRRPPLQRGK